MPIDRKTRTQQRPPASARSELAQFAGMTIEDAAALLGSPLYRTSPDTARQAVSRPAVTSRSDVENMSDIIAAAVSQLNSELAVILNATAIAAGKLPAGHSALPLLQEAEDASRRSAVKAAKLLAFAQWTGARPAGGPGIADFRLVASALKSQR